MSQSNQNPFQAPIQSTANDQTPQASDEVLDFVVIAKKWEKYRLIYNGILVCETILLTALLLLTGTLPTIELPVAAVLGAIAVTFSFYWVRCWTVTSSGFLSRAIKFSG